MTNVLVFLFVYRCRGGGSGRGGGGSHLSEEPKSCCGVALTQAASIRWFIVLIAFVGVCCAVVGTVLNEVPTKKLKR